jgi:hypothetical protein
VIVWLGKSLARTERAIGLIQYLSQIPEDKFDVMKRYQLSRKESYQKLGMELISLGDWRIVRSFMERNWFKRVWTVQEYCSPRFVTAISGGYQVPFTSLFQVSNMLMCTDWCVQLANLDISVEFSETTINELATSDIEHTARRYNESLNRTCQIPIDDLRYTTNVAPGVQPAAMVQMRVWLWPADDAHGGGKVDLLESFR